METLILVRHAHRDLSKGRHLDNGLSAKGKKQRRKFTHFYLKTYGKNKPLLLSSPSKRCLQTLKELSKQTGVKIHRKEQLVEQGFIKKSEPIKLFKTRVLTFCKALRKTKNSTVVLCSHGDWIPIALEYFTGENLEIKKGRWKVIRF